jgi:hypothetical protein
MIWQPAHSTVECPSFVQAAILRLDDKLLDTDTVENLIKFCPTKEETDTLKAYDGDKTLLGKCEQVRNYARYLSQ